MLGKLHLYFGILIVVIFVLTGQYMDHAHNHLQDMELMSRALFRAGHLYILLFGLINASLGAYFRMASSPLARRIQVFGSVVIIAATILVVYAFFTELPATEIERPMTRYSLYMVLVGVSVHGLLALFAGRKAGL